MLLKTNN